MTTEQLKKELSDWKRKLEAMKKNNLTAGIAKSEKEIARIESKLAELEKSDNKPESENDDKIRYIAINEPSEINSQKLKYEVKRLIENGYKTNELRLKMNFTTDEPKLLTDKFQVIKNKIALARDFKKKPAKKSKSKLGKSVKEIVTKEETGGNAMVSVDTEKKYKYDSKVIKHSDEHYIVLYNSDTTKDAEIKLGEDGNWELICKEVKDYPKFKKGQVEMAINFVLEVKDCIHSKVSRMEQAKKRKEIRKKYDRKSESEKAENTVDKAAESVEKRVEEAKEEGKSITPKAADNIALDVKAIVKAVKSGLSDNAKRKAFIQKLISELQKMLK